MSDITIDFRKRLYVEDDFPYKDVRIEHLYQAFKERLLSEVYISYDDYDYPVLNTK